MLATWLLLEIIFSHSIIAIETDVDLLLQQDPSKWPGHLEPLGSQQKTADIEVIDFWPDPIRFFEDYVDKSKPVLFKGLAKFSPAYKLFDDEYLKTFDGAETSRIYAEPEKKENRTKEGYFMSFKEFIERYHHENLYLVYSLPRPLRQHVRMPAPLRCNETRKLMKMQVTWFSSGGTKSVLHNDNIDNINCLFRGSKQLWMIDYQKNRRYIPLDHPNGAYSSLDVDKVNYTKYPDLRKVDKYHYVKMEEGDCIFIPYLWVHQVNSVANENGQNLAVNIWFIHELLHRPKQCDIPVSEATIDKYEFEQEEDEEQEQEESRVQDDSDDELPQPLKAVYTLLSRHKDKKAISLRLFLKILKKLKETNPYRYKMEGEPEEFRSLGEKMFKMIDVNGDSKLTKEDLIQITSLNAEQFESFMEMIDMHVQYLQIYFRDLVDEKKKEKLLKKEKENTRSNPEGEKGGASHSTSNVKSEKVEL